MANTKLREQVDAVEKAAAKAEPGEALVVGKGAKARPVKVLHRASGGWVIGIRQIEAATHKFVADAQFSGRVEMGAVVTQAVNADGKPIPDHYDCL